jgi:hypothetical protein
MASNRILIPIKDGNGKTSSVTAPCTTPTDQAITNLHAAVDLITLGKLGQVSYVVETAKDAPQAGLAPGAATRNNKWLCTYQDNVDASLHHMEIPTADLAQQATPGNTLDLAGGNGATFKAAFEAAVKSPTTAGQGGGNAVTLLSVEYVGRSLNPG